ncbi:uncharacterized protein LOC134513767 [Chroicocephalus ridibundus]|uniref:uncharacterized protein LOC134513767 n=1 Tax=Chroicocephalus ridibundus TaxID=1192867 RepID=UPI002FDD974E
MTPPAAVNAGTAQGDDAGVVSVSALADPDLEVGREHPEPGGRKGRARCPPVVLSGRLFYFLLRWIQRSVTIEPHTRHPAALPDAGGGSSRTEVDNGTAAVTEQRKLFHLSLTRKPGESANAVPHYHKLCSRVSRIWGNRRGQHTRSAGDEPRPGKTTCLIMVSPLPGKYDSAPHTTPPAPRRTHTHRTTTTPATPRAPPHHAASRAPNLGPGLTRAAPAFPRGRRRRGGNGSRHAWRRHLICMDTPPPERPRPIPAMPGTRGVDVSRGPHPGRCRWFPPSRQRGLRRRPRAVRALRARRGRAAAARLPRAGGSGDRTVNSEGGRGGALLEEGVSMQMRCRRHA